MFFTEKNGIRCACANSMYRALSQLCGRGLGTRLDFSGLGRLAKGPAYRQSMLRRIFVQTVPIDSCPGLFMSGHEAVCAFVCVKYMFLWRYCCTFAQQYHRRPSPLFTDILSNLPNIILANTLGKVLFAHKKVGLWVSKCVHVVVSSPQAKTSS